MNERDQFHRIAAHAANYHGNYFWILGLGRAGFQGGYGRPNTTSAKAAQVFESLDELLQRMTQPPCRCFRDDEEGK
jgi:hypothetical protein